MTEVCRIASAVAKGGNVDASDILELRRTIYRDGIVSREEAGALFDIDRRRTSHSDAWSDLFVEAITDYALNQEPPVGYLAEDTANWLVDEISKQAKPSTDADIELVTNIIEKAREVPAAFAAFALRLVKNMIIYGGGPDARGRPHPGGRVSEADTSALARILWGAGGEGLMAISREEAEALFDIVRASAGAENDPKFDDLFAKAIGNYLLGATGHAVPPREVALRQQTDQVYHTQVLNVLTRTLASVSKVPDTQFVIDTIRNARSLGDDVEHAFAVTNGEREAAIAAASELTAAKAGWLLQHFDQGGVMTEPERALVRFLAREASKIDQSLAPVLAKAS